MTMIQQFTIDLSEFGLEDNVTMYAYNFSKEVHYVDLTGSNSLSFHNSTLGVFNEGGFGFKVSTEKYKEIQKELENRFTNSIEYKNTFSNPTERNNWMKMYDDEEKRCRSGLFQTKKQIGEKMLKTVINLFSKKEANTSLTSVVMNEWNSQGWANERR